MMCIKLFYVIQMLAHLESYMNNKGLIDTKLPNNKKEVAKVPKQPQNGKKSNPFGIIKKFCKKQS